MQAASKALLFLTGLLFNPEDGGDMFLENIGSLLSDYISLHLKRQNSSSNHKTTTISLLVISVSNKQVNIHNMINQMELQIYRNKLNKQNEQSSVTDFIHNYIKFEMQQLLHP